jgi:WD40 repeat protein
LAAAPDSPWLASADSGYDPGTIRIRDPYAGQARHTLAGHTSGVSVLAVALDRSWPASAGVDGIVRIWDVDG